MIEAAGAGDGDTGVGAAAWVSRALPGCAGHVPGSGCHRGGPQPLEELLVRNMASGATEYATSLCAGHVSYPFECFSCLFTSEQLAIPDIDFLGLYRAVLLFLLFRSSRKIHALHLH